MNSLPAKRRGRPLRTREGMNRRDDHRRCGGPPNADNHETVPAVQERDAAADSRPGIRSEVRRSVPMGVQLLQLLGVGMMSDQESTLRELYLTELEKVGMMSYAFDDQHIMFSHTLDWRFWNSIESLDIAYFQIRDYRKRATRKGLKELRDKLHRIETFLDRGIARIDPLHWYCQEGSRSLRAFRNDHAYIQIARGYIEE